MIDPYHLGVYHADMMDNYAVRRGVHHANDGWGFVGMLLMMALVFIGVFVLVKYLNHGTSTHEKGETAIDILEKRFANSEIDKKEFEEKRNVLKG
jgi:uncharacterized membrane protein